MTVNPYQPNIITAPTDWRAQAACVEWDPEIWYPDDSDTRAADFAKSICRDCPVKLQCAVTHKDEEFGIFGGTDTKERGRAHRLRIDRNERRRAKYAERIIP